LPLRQKKFYLVNIVLIFMLIRIILLNLMENSILLLLEEADGFQKKLMKKLKNAIKLKMNGAKLIIFL
jgi:hypothetical protein